MMKESKHREKLADICLGKVDSVDWKSCIDFPEGLIMVLIRANGDSR